MYALRPSYGAAAVVPDPVRDHVYSYDPATNEAKLLMHSGKEVSPPRVLTPGSAGHRTAVEAYNAAGQPKPNAGGSPAGGAVEKKLTDQPWFWPAAIGGGVLVIGLLFVALSGKRED